MIHFKEPALPTERSRTTHHLVARGGGGGEGGRGVVVWTRAAQLPPMTVESARRRRFDFKRPTVAQVLTKKGQDGRVNCVSRARHKNGPVGRVGGSFGFVTRVCFEARAPTHGGTTPSRSRTALDATTTREMIIH